MNLQGKIKVINETQTFGDKGFKKREVVVTTEEQYPQDILVEFVQDKTSLLDKFKAGDTVDIGINLRGREWTNPQGEVKYFNSIQGWKINKAETTVLEPAFEPAPELNNDNDNDDLPF